MTEKRLDRITRLARSIYIDAKGLTTGNVVHHRGLIATLAQIIERNALDLKRGGGLHSRVGVKIK